MASKASRWNEDDSPLARVHGGTAKDALRAIKEAARTTPPQVVAKIRKDRLRKRVIAHLEASGFQLMSCDVVKPYLRDDIAPLSATAGITPAHSKVWKRCGGICHYCGEPMMRLPNERRSFTLDHVVPRSRGGSNHLSNLVGSCAECNQDKGSLTGEEYEAVLAVRRSKEHGYAG